MSTLKSTASAVVFFGLIVSVQSQEPFPSGRKTDSPKQSHAAQSQQATDYKQGDSQETPFFVKIVPTEKTEPEKAKEARESQEKAATDWWLMVFTGAVAIFTGALVLATYFLYRAGEKQIKLARDEFIASHRPRIRIRRIDMEYPFDDTYKIKITIANVGETESWIRQVHFRIYKRRREIYSHFLEEKFICSEILPRTLASGEPYTFTVHRDIPKTGEIIANADLCIAGFIPYRDQAGRIRQTGFFRIMNSANRFVRGDDHGYDYEYED